MKIQIGKMVICSKARLKRKLIEAKAERAHEINPANYYYIMGCYDSHWFGICVYRNNLTLKNQNL